MQAFRSFTNPRRPQRIRALPAGGGSAQAAGRVEQRRRTRTIDVNAPWSQADPRVRRWVEENREAMALYRQGSERPDALDPDLPIRPRLLQDRRVRPPIVPLRWPCWRRSRLEEQGDMAGAWGWYRAALRRPTTWACAGRSSGGSVPRRWNVEIRRRVSAWAADPRTTPAMIRQALDDAVACGAFVPSETYTIKVGYPWDEADARRPEQPGPVCPHREARPRLSARWPPTGSRTRSGGSPMPGGSGDGSRSGAVG